MKVFATMALYILMSTILASCGGGDTSSNGAGTGVTTETANWDNAQWDNTSWK